jgi:hypothetical protein
MHTVAIFLPRAKPLNKPVPSIPCAGWQAMPPSFIVMFVEKADFDSMGIGAINSEIDAVATLFYPKRKGLACANIGRRAQSSHHN